MMHWTSTGTIPAMPNTARLNRVQRNPIRVKLISYFKSHALRADSKVAAAKDTTNIGRALRWIKHRGGTVTARDVQMSRIAMNAAEAKELLHYLAEAGYGAVSKGQRGSLTFQLSATGQRLNVET